MPKFTVTLNGTAENPYTRMGFTQNPFPQIAKVEYSRLNQALAVLAFRPMPTAEHLLATLKELGCASAEFINSCLANYEPGQRTSFVASFPDE
jgi:hypothetical protein